MSDNYGKKFEQKFLEDMIKIPEISIDRIYDVTFGYSHISNISDFIVYKYPYIFYAETKAYQGNTFPLSKLTQYDKLIDKKGIKGVIAGVIIWYYEKDKVMFCPIENVEIIKNNGDKSIHWEKHKDYLIEIPSVKKRVYMDSDYNIIFDWKLQNDNNNY